MLVLPSTGMSSCSRLWIAVSFCLWCDYAGSPTGVFCVPVSAQYEFASKVVEEVFIVFDFDPMSGWAVYCGYVEGPWLCFDLDDCCLFFVRAVRGNFVVLQGFANKYCCASVGSAIWVVAVVY